MSRVLSATLFTVVTILLSISIAIAQQTASPSCQLAIPRYGVVQCQSTSSNEYPIAAFSCPSGSTTCSASFTCISNCQISSANEIRIDCPTGLKSSISTWTVYKNGVKVTDKGIFGGGTFPIIFDRGDTIRVDATCTQLVTSYPVQSTSQVTIQQLKIMLYEGWAGTLPTAPIQGTEGCSIQKVIDNYKGQADVQSYLNPTTGSTESKLPSTYTSTSQMPTNWKVSDTYIFVKDWQTGIADISLTYDKANKAYWCGGQFGSRKIYNVNQITSASGACYAIPQTIALSNIQCCFPSDCLALDPSGKLTCNPDTWKCEETKPCNSNLDCEQTFSSGICQNKQSTSWSCDTTKKWGSYAGTCVKTTKTVQQCPSDCTANEYYNDQQGKCVPKVTLVQCPAGKCCKSGGNYIEKACDAGLQCCINNDPIIGECKASCSSTTSTQGGEQPAGTGTEGKPFTGLFVLSPNLMVGIVAAVVVVIGVAIYFLRKKGGFGELGKKEGKDLLGGDI